MIAIKVIICTIIVEYLYEKKLSTKLKKIIKIFISVQLIRSTVEYLFKLKIHKTKENIIDPQYL